MGSGLQEGAARRRGSVNGRIESTEPDAALAELVDEGDEFADEASQPLEVEYDEDVTAAHVVAAGRLRGSGDRTWHRRYDPRTRARNSDRVEAACHRGDLFVRGRILIRHWADYLAA